MQKLTDTAVALSENEANYSRANHKRACMKILLRGRTALEGTSRIVEAAQEGRGLAEKKTSSKVTVELAGERAGAQKAERVVAAGLTAGQLIEFFPLMEVSRRDGR